MKNLVKEILLILIASIILGLLYNYFSSKPLPLIYKQPQLDTISDSLLFFKENNIKLNTADTLKFNLAETKTPNSPIETKPAGTAFKKDSTRTAALDFIKKSVSFEQMQKCVENNDIIIIDARSPEDYAKGHIGKAINIFPYLEQGEYLRKLNSLDDTKVIITYCDGGNCDLSHKVVEDLNRFGFKRVLIYQGGWDEWLKKKI